MGGDEFVAIFSNCNENQAKELIKRIKNKLQVNTKSVMVTYSFGVLTIIKPLQNSDDVIRKADKLMYSIKRKGKNGIKFSSYK